MSITTTQPGSPAPSVLPASGAARAIGLRANLVWTLFGNTATFGAGIYNASGSLTTANDTIVNNTASQAGGGVNNLGSLKAINTLLKSPAIDSTIKAVLRAEYARIWPEVERLRLVGMAAWKHVLHPTR